MSDSTRPALTLMEARDVCFGYVPERAGRSRSFLARRRRIVFRPHRSERLWKVDVAPFAGGSPHSVERQCPARWKALGPYGTPQTGAPRGLVPQTQTHVFPFTALEVVLTGRSPYTTGFGFEAKRDRQIALEALDAVDASHVAARPVTELSGGERQLVAVAQALAQQTDCLLLDEPAASLDLKHRAQLFRVLRRMKRERGLTVVVVTHDLQLLDPSFEYLFGMREGRIVAHGAPTQVLQEESLVQIYDDAHVRTHRVNGRTFVWSDW